MPIINIDEIVDIACTLAETGVHLIDLTMGEDPQYLSNHAEEYRRLVEVVDLVKKNTGLPIMISPGVVPKEIVVELKRAGANMITSLIPAEGGLVGVSQSTLDITEGHWTVQGIIPILKECGLTPATLDEDVKWMKKMQGLVAREEAM